MDNQVSKHVCGQCNDEWLTDAEYLAHTCPKSGFAPTAPENLGAEFIDIQRSALERGLETIKADGADPIQVAVQEEAIQQL
jgi:hypothetical protein